MPQIMEVIGIDERTAAAQVSLLLAAGWYWTMHPSEAPGLLFFSVSMVLLGSAAGLYECWQEMARVARQYG